MMTKEGTDMSREEYLGIVSTHIFIIYYIIKYVLISILYQYAYVCVCVCDQ